MNVCGGGHGRVLRKERSPCSLLNVRGSQLAQGRWSLRLGKGRRAHTRPSLQEFSYLGGLGTCSLLAKTVNQWVMEDRTLEEVVKGTSSPLTATRQVLEPHLWNEHDSSLPCLPTRGFILSIANKYILKKYIGVL